MKNALLAWFAVAVLAGCASAERIQRPGGKPAYVITCGSIASANCYSKAAEVCPGGYTVVQKDDGGGGAMPPGGNTSGLMRGPGQLVVQCKE